MASKRRRRKVRPAPWPKPFAKAGPARYRIKLKPAAERDLAALERRDLVRVARKIDALASGPRPNGAEKLKGMEDLWRVRAGDFRIIYTIQDDVLWVLVVRVGHRGAVYRRM